MTDEADRIPTNLRLLYLLEAMGGAERPLSAAELGELVDLPKPTLHRLCATLEAEGFLARDPQGGRLRPGRRARRMAAGLQAVSRLHIARRAALRSVAERIKETCNLAVPGDGGMTYLDRVDTPWPLRFQLPVGTEVPFHCTASGKLFLASHPDAELDALLGVLPLTPEGPNAITDRDELREEVEAIRAAKHAWDNEEFMAGMIAFAVPVRDPAGRFACALAFHAPVQRIGFEEGRRWVPVLEEGARKVEAVMFGDGGVG